VAADGRLASRDGQHAESLVSHRDCSTGCREGGQSLYCWYGPPVAEYVVASGSSEELDAYLSTKRRPRG
jgi:hypothetical protein